MSLFVVSLLVLLPSVQCFRFGLHHCPEEFRCDADNDGGHFNRLGFLNHHRYKQHPSSGALQNAFHFLVCELSCTGAGRAVTAFKFCHRTPIKFCRRISSYYLPIQTDPSLPLSLGTNGIPIAGNCGQTPPLNCPFIRTWMPCFPHFGTISWMSCYYRARTSSYCTGEDAGTRIPETSNL